MNLPLGSPYVNAENDLDLYGVLEALYFIPDESLCGASKMYH